MKKTLSAPARTKTSVMTAAVVQHIAKLANIPITPIEEKKLADGFTTTLGVVDQLKKLDTSTAEPTHQVTGLQNVLRDDGVDRDRMFTQEQALANAPHTHNGYIVVEQILDQE
ncbi:MAG: hypothetical protein A2804_00500 [Candidatus Pacebacteria bacterium RIFCSPHIGHO2_01_FULL_46_10]|nr:MAG: hypothetical protein A2804_00500 [Candidatus Pacebacteria bacterium RIFCSPHIGHO2_01_FULL_46_10]